MPGDDHECGRRGEAGGGEAEATVERGEPREADPGADVDERTAPETPARSDRAADSFLELEDELAAGETTADPADGTRPRGLVVGAETVPAAAVPESYPIAIGTDEALALTLDLGDRETTAYLEWPGSGGVDSASALGRLLAALDVSAESFADLYGERLLLDREAGHYTVYVPPEPPRGSGDWSLAVVGAFAFNVAFLATLALAGTAAVPPGPGALAFVLVNWLVLPYATYGDATYLRTHSDWEQGPAFWATLSMLPWLNLLVVLAYLYSRSRAAFLGSEPSLRARLVRRLRAVLP